jgi:hypothetical protein
MNNTDIILVCNNNKLMVRYRQYYDLKNMNDYYPTILVYIRYLSNNYFYYNSKIVVYEFQRITLATLIMRCVNYTLENYFNPYIVDKHFSGLNLINYSHALLTVEYKIKLINDKCIVELIEYIKNREKILFFYKNELPFFLHNWMMLHFNYAKNCKYEKCPVGFSDSF